MKVKYNEVRSEGQWNFHVTDKQGNSVAYGYLKDGEDFLAVKVHRWLDIHTLDGIIKRLKKYQKKKREER